MKIRAAILLCVALAGSARAADSAEEKYAKENIGRPDLADDYEARLVRGKVLLATGALALAGCVIAGTLVSLQDGHSHAAAGGMIGIGGGAFGLLLIAAANTSQRQPVSAPELREMADQYNQGLRQRLGLGPVVREDGGGLEMSLRF